MNYHNMRDYIRESNNMSHSCLGHYLDDFIGDWMALCRLSNFYDHVIELGTNVGISSAYIGAALKINAQKGKMTTLEASLTVYSCPRKSIVILVSTTYNMSKVFSRIP